MSIKTFEGFVNQIEDTKVVELQFSNSKDYYKAISVLYDNGFERPSFNPPTEGKITYKSDDHWRVAQEKEQGVQHYNQNHQQYNPTHYF